MLATKMQVVLLHGGPRDGDEIHVPRSWPCVSVSLGWKLEAFDLNGVPVRPRIGIYSPDPESMPNIFYWRGEQ